METIEGVAIKDGMKVYFLLKPNRHADLIKHMIKECGAVAPVNGVQGFYTSNKRFVNRKRAAQIAWDSWQIKVHKYELYSEDIW